MHLPFLNWEKLPPLPDAEGFAAPFSGSAGGALLVAGGANFPGKRPWEGGTKIWYDSVFALPAPDGAWTLAGRLPRPNAYGLSVTTDEGIVCIGGGNIGEHFAEVFLLTWDGRQLATRPLPSLPQPCAFMAGALAGHMIYVAGGIGKPDATEALNVFWSLDLANPKPGWRVLPSCPGPARMLAVAGTLGDTFYLFSGAGLHAGSDGKPVRTVFKDAYAYTPAQGWRRLADLSRAAVAAPSPAPVTSGGQLLVLTGDDGCSVHLNGPRHPGFPQDALAYQPNRDRWIKVGTAPFSRATVPTAFWRGRWIVANGERIPGYRTPEVWSLDFNRPQ